MELKITLKAARVNAGLTQPEAAKRLGVTKDVISNWERHKTYPDASMIPKIELVYGVEYSKLIFLPQHNALSVSQ